MSDQPLLHAENLARHYPISRGLFSKPAQVKALDGVSFSLEAGKTLAVVGESGCGKSTLARLVTMIEEPTSGTLTIDGENVATAGKTTLKSMRGAVQIVFQDPYGSLNPRQRIGVILEEPLKINTAMNAQERRQAAQEMMVRVGLRPEHYGRYPHMFSGGQRQRIAIARALMLHPRIIILDEPVSALDVSIQAQVLNLLADLQEEFNLAYMFISHDLSVVRHVADDVVVMYLGKVVERADRDTLFRAPVHPYTRALLSATPRTDPKARQERIKLTGELPSPIDPPTGCPFHPRCFMAQEKCRKEVPAPEVVGENHIAACHFWNQR